MQSSNEAAKRSLAGAEAEAGKPKSCEEPEAKCGTRGLHFRAKHAVGAKLLERRLHQTAEREREGETRASESEKCSMAGERVPI